jgi:hypothetical protein
MEGSIIPHEPESKGSMTQAQAKVGWKPRSTSEPASGNPVHPDSLKRRMSLGDAVTMGASAVDEFVPDWLATWRIQQANRLPADSAMSHAPQQQPQSSAANRHYHPPLNILAGNFDQPHATFSAKNTLRWPQNPANDIFHKPRKSVTFGVFDQAVRSNDNNDVQRPAMRPIKSILAKSKLNKGVHDKRKSLSEDRGIVHLKKTMQPASSSRHMGTFI